MRLIMQAAFNGHRVVINSGGEAKGEKDIVDEVRELQAGGSFGSIVGRNAFQRPKQEAIKLLHQIQDSLTPESNATLLARSAKDVKLDSYE